MVIILMGVTGSGKTTIGRALAASLKWQFIDADAFHSPANVAKMRDGVPLDDEDRLPWLANLHDAIARWLQQGANVVLACSALKNSYREQLLIGEQVKLVYLRGNADVISQRLSHRRDHYMDPALLPSQFATLEEPRNALVIDIDASVSDIAALIRSELAI